jgi:uncharacterized Rmd1/YagE family protein
MFFNDRTSIDARAFLLGEHLDLRALETTSSLGLTPLAVAAGEHGVAVLFRYGAVVLFNLSPLEEVSFLAQLKPLLREPFAEPDTEESEVHCSAGHSRTDRVENGVLHLADFSIERLQIVADVLAKSTVLAHYEDTIAGVFESIEPLAHTLRDPKTSRRRDRFRDEVLLSHIGNILLIEHKMVGLVEVAEKPETLWEAPELERLYGRLEDEYELRERHTGLERKLAVITRTAETVLNLLQHKSGLRVEWYIVALIVFEIGLSLYEMFFKHGS